MPKPDHHAILLGRIRKNRALIRCIRADLLAGCLEQPCGDPWIRARIAGELTIRAWHLAGRSGWTELPERPMIERAWSAYGLAPEVWAALGQWIDGQAQVRSFDPPPAVAQSPHPFGLLLTHDLAQWRSADGLVFFASNGDDSLEPCTALPFMLEVGSIGHQALVHTADHQALRGLDDGIRLATQTASRMATQRNALCLRVVFLTMRGTCDGLLGGASLSLPVLMAWQLKTWGADTNFETVLTTGTLSQNGQLDPNAGSAQQLETKQRFMQRLAGRVLVLPCAGNADDARTLYWPCAQPLAAHFERLRESLGLNQTRVAGLPDPKAEEHLRTCDAGMRYGNMSARAVLADLAPLYEKYRGRADLRGKRLRSRTASLLAAAECHMGNPVKTGEWCSKVLEDKEAAGPYFTAQTLIRQAVALTDQARYSEATSLCETAEDLAAQVRDLIERNDIQLQASGTKGQCLMYWGLFRDDLKERALTALDRAAELARELDAGDPGAQQRDLPRNLNYIAMWFALHKPQAIQNPLRMAQSTGLDDPTSQGYLRRINWLAAYRALHMNLPFDWQTMERKLPGEAAEGEWLLAMSLKYRATLRAQAGRVEEAIEDFAHSAKLANVFDRSPLLGFLGATAALQAGESLLQAAPDVARQHLKTAVSIFSKTENWFEGPIKGCLWAERAAGILKGLQPPSLPDPQRFYPY